MEGMHIDLSNMKWFKTNPPTGDPNCICSACGKKISEDETCVRLICKPCYAELRLHCLCFCEYVTFPFLTPVKSPP